MQNSYHEYILSPLSRESQNCSFTTFWSEVIPLREKILNLLLEAKQNATINELGFIELPSEVLEGNFKVIPASRSPEGLVWWLWTPNLSRKEIKGGPAGVFEELLRLKVAFDSQFE